MTTDTEGPGIVNARNQVDARAVVSYLVAPESDDYIAVMRVLEPALDELTPAEVAAQVGLSGKEMDPHTAETRLRSLQSWGAAGARQDTSQARLVADLLPKNLRYYATPEGKRTQRFFDEALSQNAPVREIAFPSLRLAVAALHGLATAPDTKWADRDWVRDKVAEVFSQHGSLDESLIGSEDVLLALSNRFDLDDGKTTELKDLLIGYATRAVYDLEVGSHSADQALEVLAPRFAQLAQITIATSEAADLIGRNVYTASRGGNVADWDALRRWFDPTTGRVAAFSHRIMAALPALHANVRRLHTFGDTTTSRSRALALAAACLDPTRGRQVFVAALGDHPWRKFHAVAEDPGAGRTPPWRDGPQVEVTTGLRTLGHANTRGRAAAPRDNRADREHLEALRKERVARRAEQVAEILAMTPGQTLSAGAGRLAFARLLEARLRPADRRGRRTASRDDLACTLIQDDSAVGSLACATFTATVPGWRLVFHDPGTRPALTARSTAPAGQADGKPNCVDDTVLINTEGWIA